MIIGYPFSTKRRKDNEIGRNLLAYPFLQADKPAGIIYGWHIYTHSLLQAGLRLLQFSFYHFFAL
jgi:hypothetical protein